VNGRGGRLVESECLANDFDDLLEVILASAHLQNDGRRVVEMVNTVACRVIHDQTIVDFIDLQVDVSARKVGHAPRIRLSTHMNRSTAIDGMPSCAAWR
jgi:hypothetical protein